LLSETLHICCVCEIPLEHEHAVQPYRAAASVQHLDSEETSTSTAGWSGQLQNDGRFTSAKFSALSGQTRAPGLLGKIR